MGHVSLFPPGHPASPTYRSFHQGRVKKARLFLLHPPLGLSRTFLSLDCHKDAVGWHLKPTAQQSTDISAWLWVIDR